MNIAIHSKMAFPVIRVMLKYSPEKNTSLRIWTSVDTFATKSVADFIEQVRQKLKISSSKQIKLYVKECLLPADETIGLLREDDIVSVQATRASEPSCEYDDQRLQNVKVDKEHRKRKRNQLNCFGDIETGASEVIAHMVDATTQTTGVCAQQNVSAPLGVSDVRSRQQGKKKRKRIISNDVAPETSNKFPEHVGSSKMMSTPRNPKCNLLDSVENHSAICAITPEQCISFSSVEQNVADSPKLSFVTEEVCDPDWVMKKKRRRKHKRNKKQKTNPQETDKPVQKINLTTQNPFCKSKTANSVHNKHIVFNDNEFEGVEMTSVSEVSIVSSGIVGGLSLVNTLQGLDINQSGKEDSHAEVERACLSLEQEDRWKTDAPRKTDANIHMTPSAVTCIKENAKEENVNSALDDCSTGCRMTSVSTILPSEKSQSLKKTQNSPSEYTRYPMLSGLPRVGDVVVYKVLQLSENYTPEISSYKKGTVIMFDNSTGMAQIKLDVPEVEGPRMGKFEIINEGEGEGSTIIKEVAEVNWQTLIEPRLVS